MIPPVLVVALPRSVHSLVGNRTAALAIYDALAGGRA